MYEYANNTPCTSFNDMGLLLLLKPTDTIIEVTNESIKICSKSGSISVFYKKILEGVKRFLLYELNHPRLE